MSLNRTKSWLAALALVFLIGAPAFAQGLRDMQLFAPATTSDYGGGLRPNQGLFFSFDWLHWTISSPDATTIGFEGLGPVTVYTQLVPEPVAFDEYNTHGTGPLSAEFTSGERIEVGNVYGHHGWFFSGFWMNNQNQDIVATNAHVLFQDPPITGLGYSSLQGYVDDPALDVRLPDGSLPRLPVMFDDLLVENSVETWGVELNYLIRTHPGRHGGILELFLGARYMQFNEEFNVEARGRDDAGVPTGVNSILADSYWFTDAENHIVGPQAGARWFRQSGRWTLSTEGRFFAGFNQQNLSINGLLGSKLSPPGGEDEPLAMAPTSFNHSDHESEWSPGGELRVDLKCQLTQALAVRLGWTGMWQDGIARASNSILYQTPRMGLRNDDNRQSVFMNGLNVGLEINR